MKFLKNKILSFFQPLTEKVVEIEKGLFVIYRRLNEIDGLVKELRNQVNEIPKAAPGPKDLPIYNFKDMLAHNLPKIDDCLPEKMSEEAKARMETYRKMEESRLKDMEALRAVLQKEADDSMKDIKHRYGIK